MNAIFSEVTGRRYLPEDCVYFKNAKQSASYIAWGAELVDLMVTEDKDRDGKTLVFVFSKEDHNKYKSKWMNHEK